MRRAFFFPHPPRPNIKPGGLPGRVAFDVSGHVIAYNGARWGDVTIFADGYQRNTVGSNQDPCVLSSPLGPIHAFCRINGRTRDYHVREVARHDRLLPQAVSSGDLIVYGKFAPAGKCLPITSIWVDSVIVVQEVLSVGTVPRVGLQPCNARGHCRRRRFTLLPPWTHQHGPLTAVNRESDAFRYCLSDAEPDGLHCCTRLGSYNIIHGCVDPTVDAVRELRTSFVPVQSPEANSPVTVSVANFDTQTWQQLRGFLESRVRTQGGGPRGGWIAEFPSFDLAHQLCNAVWELAGEVAIPPLQLRSSAGRWDPVQGKLGTA